VPSFGAIMRMKSSTMIALTKREVKDLKKVYSSYKIEPQESVQSGWFSRKFPSSGRIIRCTINNDCVIIKQIVVYSK
jgi:hypothetical protein